MVIYKDRYRATAMSREGAIYSILKIVTYKYYDDCFN